MRRIKPHAPLLVRGPVNSFEFEPCDRTPQAGHLRRTFDKTDDILGQLAMRAALVLVETNLTYDMTQYLLKELRMHGFSSAASDRAWVRMKPEMISRFQVFSFDSANVNQLDAQIAKRVDHTIPDSVAKHAADYEQRLASIVERAAADSAKKPVLVISTLSRPFSQRAWLQIQDKRRRVQMRDRICGLLINAYYRTNKQSNAALVQQYLDIEKKSSAGK